MQEMETIRPDAVANLAVEERSAFIMRTYVHLFGAILLFTGFEVLLFQTGAAYAILEFVAGSSWLLILGAFMLVSWFATRTAHTAESKAAQYGALIGFVLFEALIFAPLLFIADYYAPGAIQSAALITLLGTGALTGIAFSTRKDFTFLGGLLRWGFAVALLLVVAGVIFSFELGTIFSVAMIALAGGAILNDTSKIMYHYPEDRYVGASLELFASVALMFWYVLRLLSRR